MAELIEEARRLQSKLAEFEKALNMDENPFELFDVEAQDQPEAPDAPPVAKTKDE